MGTDADDQKKHEAETDPTSGTFPVAPIPATATSARSFTCIAGAGIKDQAKKASPRDGILGVIGTLNGELTLRLFSRDAEPIANVIGSKSYLSRALLAVGLALPAALAKCWNGTASVGRAKGALQGIEQKLAVPRKNKR